MSVEPNFVERMARSNDDATGRMGFILNLDLLSGCRHRCGGCFVDKDRKDENWKRTIRKALAVADGLVGKGLSFAEVVLSPTDFFSAQNTHEILLDPDFQELFRFEPFTRIATTGMFDGVDRRRFQELFSILDDERYFRPDLIMEFLSPLDAKKLLARDPAYLADHHWAIDYLVHSTPKVCDWSFSANIAANEVLRRDFGEVSRLIREEFATILEFNPGFFRTGSDQLIVRSLKNWQALLEDVLDRHDHRELNLVDVNYKHSASNQIALHFHGDEVYVSPFLFEQLLDRSEVFRLRELGADHILRRHVELQAAGFAYSARTDDCADCHLLFACAGRNVLNFMESRAIKACPLPRQYRDISRSVMVAVP